MSPSSSRRATLLFASLLLAANSQADSIALNFATGRNAGNGGTVSSGTAGVVAQPNWNNGTGNNGSLGNLIDDSGSATGASATWTSNNTWSINGSNYSSGNNALMNGYLDTTDSSTTTVTIT
ncbi:MAG: hypothetical protein P8J87_04550, partial [Verrucomicrobiales bacterium]|nr:hypothetical protein [Verrucomicrobiales bacterium]